MPEKFDPYKTTSEQQKKFEQKAWQETELEEKQRENPLFQKKLAEERKMERFLDIFFDQDARLEIKKELFPYRLKTEALFKASKNAIGTPVTYFRTMSNRELKNLFLQREINIYNNEAQLKGIYHDKKFVKKRLISFCGKLPGKEKECSIKEIESLPEDFTIEEYLDLLYKKIPRKILFEFHKSGGTSGAAVTGLIPLCVCAPIFPPAKENVVVEFTIPDNKIIIPATNNLNIELEKEVCTRKLEYKNIIDIFIDDEDIIKRLFSDKDNYSIGHFYGKRANSIDGVSRNRYDIYDVLQAWKDSFKLKDLIPIKKQKDMDPENPDLERPLL